MPQPVLPSALERAFFIGLKIFGDLHAVFFFEALIMVVGDRGH